MGKLSPEKAAQLKALQEEEAAQDGEEDAAWVRLADGREVRLTGERLHRFMQANGFDEADADAATKGTPLDAKGAAAGAKPQAKGTAAKKPAAEGDGADEGEGAELDADKPATGTGRRFF